MGQHCAPARQEPPKKRSNGRRGVGVLPTDDDVVVESEAGTTATCRQLREPVTMTTSRAEGEAAGPQSKKERRQERQARRQQAQAPNDSSPVPAQGLARSICDQNLPHSATDALHLSLSSLSLSLPLLSLSFLSYLYLSLSSCVGSRLPDELLYRCIREGERVLVRSKLPPTVSP